MGKSDTELSEREIERRSDATLRRLLATPPQPKTKGADKANPPKKRGRPAKTKSLSSDLQNN
jgi:hypothetical protein